MTRALFSKGLDGIATKWLKHEGAIDESAMRRELGAELLNVAEAFVLSPNMVFKVYGENVVAAQLLKMFGYEAFRSLLESREISFVLWTELVTKTDDEDLLRQGVVPLQSGRLNSAAHADPEASADLGLRGWAPDLPRTERRALTRLIAKRTKPLRAGASSDAVHSALDAHQAGQLRSFGLDPSVEPERLDFDGRQALCGVAERLLEAEGCLRSDGDFADCLDVWETVLLSQSRTDAPEKMVDLLQTILTLERIPSIGRLVLAKKLNFADLVRIRKTSEARQFRDWLWSQPDPAAKEEVLAAYLATMDPTLKVTEREWFKAIRIATVGVVGTGAGVLATAALGPAAGVGAGLAAGTAASVAVSWVDGLLLDRLTKGNNPRLLSTNVLGPMLAKQSSGTS